MTTEEFIKRLRIAVHDSAIRITLTRLEKPLAKKPSAAELELSRWYNSLKPEDKDRVRRTVESAVRTTVFRMMTVLDGVSSIREADEPLGELELRYRIGDQSSC